MKLVRFSIPTQLGIMTRIGAWVDAGIVNLSQAYMQYLICEEHVFHDNAEAIADSVFREMRDFVGLGKWGLQQAQVAVEFALRNTSMEGLIFALSDVRLLAPIRPRVLRDCLAFEEHLKNARKQRAAEIAPAWYEMPVYYKGNPLTIVGPDEDVRWPTYSDKLDYELELGLIVGRGGRNIDKTVAESEYIYGLTIMNDFSARDIQVKEMTVGLGPAKGKDFATALGPCIVTLDEIPDLYNIKMVARVNGEIWSEGNTSTIYWRFSDIVHWLSTEDFLAPGDVIGSGTVGNGCGLELGKYLSPGDIVELEIEGIGILRNRVVR
ncbi:MAG: fumarylacetoacetate hydrolase family protein [Alicyclobacillus sp.]|nr:fumarylacetoacetate hydrolase family protein [Alicyclobacillus sp.]